MRQMSKPLVALSLVALTLLVLCGLLAKTVWDAKVKARSAVSRVVISIPVREPETEFSRDFVVPPGLYHVSLYVPLNALSDKALEFRASVAWQLYQAAEQVESGSSDLAISREDLVASAWGKADVHSIYPRSPHVFARSPLRPTNASGWPLLRWPWDALAHYEEPGVLLHHGPAIVIQEPDTLFRIQGEITVHSQMNPQANSLELRIDPYHDL